MRPKIVFCSRRKFKMTAKGNDAYRGGGGALHTRSSPTGPAEQEEGGSLFKTNISIKNIKLE